MLLDMNASYPQQLQEKLTLLHQQIQQYKTVPQVRLIAVSKTASLDQMLTAYKQGVRDFGENKPQLALEKKAQLPPDITTEITWHLIGHLQSNKVNKVVGQFDWIHSVDSQPLAQKISDRAVTLGIRQKVLLQVNLIPEISDTRSGFSEADVCQTFSTLIALPGLNITGLMTMAPNTPDITLIQSVFDRLRGLRDRLSAQYGYPLPELSMGMSQDFIHALPRGATMIRLGSYLF